MTESAPRADSETTSLRRRLVALLRHRVVRVLGAIAGLGLLALALTAVFTERDALDKAWNSLARPEPLLVLGLLGANVGNLLLTAGVFGFLIRRFPTDTAKVGRLEMVELIGASTLINFVPMKPGLFGRIAWHRVVNHIPAVNSARTIVESVGLSVGSAAVIVAALLAAHRWELPLAAPLAVPAVILVALAFPPASRPFALAGLCRFVDLLLWGARYFIAFQLIGQPISPTTALAVAIGSTAASLVPLAGNGLGLREWTTGVLTPLLSDQTLHAALTAELVNRAGELLVVVPVGLASIAGLLRRRAATTTRT